MSKFLKILLTTAAILAGNLVFAADNVLQAIQIDGVKDSYNVILKSDDVAELKKTVQAPNKMILTLKGIRASKAINTIYNNTSNVDSVVVEPIGEDSVKVLIQANNVANAGIHFDTLKTPLGVLGKTQPHKTNDELVLSDPIKSYTPVYDKDENQNEGFSLAAVGSHVKNILFSEKVTWLVALGMFILVIIAGLKTIKSKDGEIKIGLTQSLKDREIEMYKSGSEGLNASLNEVYPSAPSPSPAVAANNYGLRAYQNGMRSPYLTPEIQRPRPVTTPSPSVNPQVIANSMAKRPAMQSQSLAQNTIKPTTNTFSALKTAPVETKARTTNIDSIKFLESMTKIYEKNGRKDLAQGLRANMKKVQKTTI